MIHIWKTGRTPRSYKKDEVEGDVPVGSTVVVELTENVADKIEKTIASNISQQKIYSLLLVKE